MKAIRQVSLRKKMSVSGIGLHAGIMAEVTLHPAPKNHGIVLRRKGFQAGQGDFILSGITGAQLVKHGPLATVLENSHGTTIGTVEHLLSALHGLRVDNLLVEIDGPEVPILDGSALPWVELIDKAEREELSAPRQWLKIERTVRHEDAGRVMLAEPDARAALRIECHVEYPHPAVGRQTWRGVIDEVTYRSQIAPARTFVLEKDIAAAQAAGLIKGGGLHNAVVFGEDGQVQNPEGLRFPNEPVRHKVLDAVGDMFTAGQCLRGKLTLNAPGHTANNMLLRRLLE